MSEPIKKEKTSIEAFLEKEQIGNYSSTNLSFVSLRKGELELNYKVDKKYEKDNVDEITNLVFLSASVKKFIIWKDGELIAKIIPDSLDTTNYKFTNVKDDAEVEDFIDSLTNETRLIAPDVAHGWVFSKEKSTYKPSMQVDIFFYSSDDDTIFSVELNYDNYRDFMTYINLEDNADNVRSYHGMDMSIGTKEYEYKGETKEKSVISFVYSKEDQVEKIEESKIAECTKSIDNFIKSQYSKKGGSKNVQLGDNAADDGVDQVDVDQIKF